MDEEYAAFCLDQAISVLGNGITSRITSAGEDKKIAAKQAQTHRKMERELFTILGIEETEEMAAKKYRTPKVTKTK